MNAKITYAVVGIIAAIGLMTAATLSAAANSAFGLVIFNNKQECFKFYQDQYKSGQISKEGYKQGKEYCRSIFQ